MHVGCCLQFSFTHPPMRAVLAVQDDDWTAIEPQLVRQDDVVRPIAAQSIPVGCIEVLKHAKKSRLRKACATAGLCRENADESVLDRFILADAASWDEIGALCGFVSSERKQHILV